MGKDADGRSETEANGKRPAKVSRLNTNTYDDRRSRLESRRSMRRMGSGDRGDSPESTTSSARLSLASGRSVEEAPKTCGKPRATTRMNAGGAFNNAGGSRLRIPNSA